jgi:hypothetical protein
VNTHDALDFLESVSGMPMKRIARAMPVASCEIDFFLLDQTGDGPDIPKEFRVLPDPADRRPREIGLGRPSTCPLAFGVETTPLFAPL